MILKDLKLCHFGTIVRGTGEAKLDHRAMLGACLCYLGVLDPVAGSLHPPAHPLAGAPHKISPSKKNYTCFLLRFHIKASLVREYMAFWQFIKSFF